MFRRFSGRDLLTVCALLVLAACGARHAAKPVVAAADFHLMDLRQIVADTGTFDPNLGLARIQQGMTQAEVALAQKFEPGAHPDFWDRNGWTTMALATAPMLPIGQMDADPVGDPDAAQSADDADADFAPAQPFVLVASKPERDRALLCLTQAVYYEAALEPVEGQRAVAQTIINRVRHPDFPKSICGVVYQDSSQAMSCQFTFTCDGSLARQPAEPYWGQARAVAEAALDGYVEPEVGSATHYHADYVFPAWDTQMVRIVQLGAHIFFRFPGPIGSPQILTGHYAGGELAVNMTGPTPDAIAAAKAKMIGAQIPTADFTPPLLALGQTPPALNMTPIPGGPLPQTPLAQAPAAVLAQAPVAPPRAVSAGDVVAGRRVPTKEEIARINAALPPASADEDDGPIRTAHDTAPPQ